jgi:uncharacterized protein (TIGR03067 family)
MRSFAFCALVVVVATAGCGKRAEPSIPSPLTGDRALVQGTWVLYSADIGRGAPVVYTPHVKFRVRFEGDTCTIFESGNLPSRFTFRMLEDRTPKVLVLTEIVGGPNEARYGSTRRNADRQTPRAPDRLEWIYKFEDEQLVIAFRPGDLTPAPSEFKARDSKSEPGQPVEPGVTILTLRRVDDDPNTAPARPAGTNRTSTRK